MKKNLKALQTGLCLLAVVLYSCGSGNSTEENAEASTKIDSQQVTSAAPAEQAAPSYSLPSPLQIAKIFKRSGLKYTDGLTNPESNMSKYSTSLSQAVNLGVYSGDLSYCVLNKQTQQSLSYMKVVRQLADKLGFGSVFEINSLSSRFEKNVSKEDSLAGIIAELQMQTDLYLEDNEQEHISAIVFAGAWVESMYLGAKVTGKEKSQKVSKKVAEQMGLLENIVMVLKSHEAKDPNISKLLADMEPIRVLYTNFPSVKNAAAHPEEDIDITLSDDEVASISKKIEELRAKFVNG